MAHTTQHSTTNHNTAQWPCCDAGKKRLAKTRQHNAEQQNKTEQTENAPVVMWTRQEQTIQGKEMQTQTNKTKDNKPPVVMLTRQGKATCCNTTQHGKTEYSTTQDDHVYCAYDKTRQDKTRQDKTRQDNNTRQDTTKIPQKTTIDSMGLF